MTTRWLFKVLNEDGTAYHGGRGRWPLPSRERLGKPLTVEGELVPCQNGLHLCEPDHLVRWLGPAIWTVQVPVGVEEIRCDDKIVVRTARLERRLETWNDRTARHFACDCAERVLHLTKGPHPAEAIRIARLFAEGLTGQKELAAAAAAATAAYAAYAAANAANAAYAANAAAYAVYAVADAAATAERDWQTQRLMQYLRGEAP